MTETSNSLFEPIDDTLLASAFRKILAGGGVAFTEQLPDGTPSWVMLEGTWRSEAHGGVLTDEELAAVARAVPAKYDPE